MHDPGFCFMMTVDSLATRCMGKRDGEEDYEAASVDEG